MELCKKCVLPAHFPNAKIDDMGVCGFCRAGSQDRSIKVTKEFKDEEEVASYLKKYRDFNRKYDVLVPLSGGLDSCNVLITIVEKYKLRPLGFHNDHGYEDPQATENVKELCKRLNTDLVIYQHDISFMKKLWKYTIEANIPGLFNCYLCGNILYLNALEVANRYNIPIVINGYSKGQILMVNNRENGLDFLDRIVGYYKKTGDNEFVGKFLSKYKLLEKQIIYQDKRDLEREVVESKILVLPFYVFDFYKTDKDELLKNVKKFINWKPLNKSYPKRSTNCNMVFLNTYMDIKKMGYSAYDFEYAELVRKGEMTREQALDDLKFEPDTEMLKALAKEIGLKEEYLQKNAYDFMQPVRSEIKQSNISILEIENNTKFKF